MSNYEHLPLHHEFDKIVAKRRNSTEEIASHWAAWLTIAHSEHMPMRHVFSEKDAEDTDNWNSAQQKFWFVTTALEDVTYQEIKKLLVNVGDFELICSLCTHALWMYSSTFICEDHIDEWLENTTKCDGCYYEALIYTFHYMITDHPLSHSFYEGVAHSDEGDWEYLKWLLKVEMAQYVKIFEEYKVTYV